MADTEQFIVGGEVWALKWAAVRARDVLPPAAGQEAVVTTCEEFGAVLERDAVSRLHGLPLVEYLGDRVAAVLAASLGAVHAIASADVSKAFGSAVGREYWRVTAKAVGARMTASSVDVDRPAEGHSGLRWYFVEDALGRHMQELQAGQLAGAALGARQSVDAEQRRLPVALLVS